jgi:4-amino-4-deoxy-L-arabinose transferase-like glycosyltransferase
LRYKSRGPVIEQPILATIWNSLDPVIWMVLVALVIRLAVVPFVYDEWMSPFNITHYEQGNVARSLLAGHGFGSPWPSNQPSAILPPVFPVIIAILFKIFGVHTQASIIAVCSVNCLFSALACVPVYLAARRGFGDRVARWSGWGWALSPYGIYFSAEWAWSTHLLLLCLCWLLYLAQRLEDSSKIASWAGFGLLAGFAGLIEPSILVVIPFLILLSGWRLRQAGKSWLAPVVTASLALALTISPWILRNALVFRRFIPMRDSMGLEMYLGNTGDSLHWRSGDRHPNHNSGELTEYNAGEVAYMDHKLAQAALYIHSHPRWYATMCLRRTVYLWTGYWSFDPRYLAQEPLDPFNIPIATATSVFSLIGLTIAWKYQRFESARFAGVLFLYPLMYYFVHPEAYRMRPLDPMLVILGCRVTQALGSLYAAGVLAAKQAYQPVS